MRRLPFPLPFPFPLPLLPALARRALPGRRDGRSGWPVAVAVVVAVTLRAARHGVDDRAQDVGARSAAPPARALLPLRVERLVRSTRTVASADAARMRASVTAMTGGESITTRS